MRFLFTFSFSLFFSVLLTAQTKPENSLPKKLQELPQQLLVNHFPATVYASSDEDRKDYNYFWKHNTSILSAQETVQIIECGAYIFYNDQWNLRVSYSPKEFSQLFNCPNATLKQGQVYTFVDNWRTDNRLVGGWAMWYFIAKTADGKEIVGYSKLETKGELLSPSEQKLKLNSKQSSLKWTGKALGSSYTLSGTINTSDGALKISNDEIQAGTIQIDMKSIDSEVPVLTKHLKSKDFFEVKKYPKANFKVQQVSKTAMGTLKMSGLLQIKDTTEPAEIIGTLEQLDSGWKYTGKLSIDRTKFGITYNSASFFQNLGDQAIADDFDLEFELYFEE